MSKAPAPFKLQPHTIQDIDDDEEGLSSIRYPRFQQHVYDSYLQRWWALTWKAIKNNKSIFLWVTAAIITNVAQAVYLKQSSNKMPKFPYFLFWFTSIPFVIAFFIFLFVAWLMGGITSEMTQIPQYKWMIIGALNTLNGLLLLFANPYVSGVMEALLGPTVVTIPMAMFFSLVLLKRKYTWKQILAVFVIMIGLFIAFYPSIFQGSTDAGPIGWDICWLLGSLPLALMTVYEEKQFAEQQIHIAYMLALSTFYQMLTIFLTFPLDAVPGFGSSTFSNLLSHQWEALKCIAGQDIPNYCPECDCESAWIPFLLFTLAYIATNFTQLGVVKYGNATFLFIVSTLSLPLTVFAFAWPLLMGDDAESISPFNYGALVGLLIGVVLYRIFDTDAHNAGEASVKEDKKGAYMTLVEADMGDSVRAITIVGGYATAHATVFAKKLPHDDFAIAPHVHRNTDSRTNFWTV